MDFAGSLDFGGGGESFSLPDFTAQAPQFEAPNFSPGFGVPETPLQGFTRGLGDVGSKIGEGVGKVGAGLGKEFSERPLESLTKSLGLGATGFNIANQVRAGSQMNEATRNIKQAQESARTAAAPAVAAGTQDIQRAQAGKLQPAMESSIEQWVQQAKADMRARYAQMGLGSSSDIASEEAKIDLMAQSMRGQLLQGEEQLGLAGVSTGVNAAIGGGNLAANQQNLLAQLIASANQSLGVLQGRQPSA